MNGLGNVDASCSLLLIVDIQTKLAPAIAGFNSILARTLQLSHASTIHCIPSLITQQYTKGLGETDLNIQKALPSAEYFEKIFFSACEESGFVAKVNAYSRPQIIVAGTEAHVCVLQTCLDLLMQGFEVIIAIDAIGSRDPLHKDVAIEQLRQAGAIISCTETIIFQWTKKAGTSTFNKILPIIK